MVVLYIYIFGGGRVCVLPWPEIPPASLELGEKQVPRHALVETLGLAVVKRQYLRASQKGRPVNVNIGDHTQHRKK